MRRFLDRRRLRVAGLLIASSLAGLTTLACGAEDAGDPVPSLSAGTSSTVGGNAAGGSGGTAATTGGTATGGSTGGIAATTGGIAATGGSGTGGSAGGPSSAGAGTGGSSGGGGAGAPSAGSSGSGGVAPASGGSSSGGAAVAGGGNGGQTNTGGSAGMPSNVCQEVTAVPDDLREEWDVEPYYQKYMDANGIPILTSNAPPDNTLTLACQLVIEMVGIRDDVRQALIDNHVHFTVIGEDEQTNDVPEYSYLDDSINTRARGLGGNPGMCAEESILCLPSDRWNGESICVHEFAHTISLYGLYDADSTFEDRLIEAYESAQDAGLFADTYAMENEQEYWGEGVQDWYYTNLESNPTNGVHGPIDTREELQEYDPVLYGLIAELLSPDVSWNDCYRDDE